MSERYRYARPRSPVNLHPARASLPINIYSASGHETHLHVVPTSRREVASSPRSSISSISTGPVTTTTYKITSDPPSSRISNLRDSSRHRSSTFDSTSRPNVLTSAPRIQHRPVIHSATGGRPASPLLNNPYRSSEEEYYAFPASSKHGHGENHHKRHSGTTDSLEHAKEREAGRLRMGTTRIETAYTDSRARPTYVVPPVRHADTVSADYGDNGYGYTNPRDLVQYDLNNTPAPRHHARRDSLNGGGAPRPSSVASYQDLANPRMPYDTRERGPPPSTRGFDRIQPRGSNWEQPAQVQMPAVVPIPPMDAIRRPARVEPAFEPEVPRRKESLARRDKPSVYHHEPRRGTQRDDFYDARPDDRRDKPHRHERYEDPVEQRGLLGTRLERTERPERVERVEKMDRVERSPPSDRDRKDYKEHKEQKEHSSGKDALGAGISIAGAALGVNALKKTRSHDDRNDRDETRRRRRDEDEYEYEDEPRRRREPKEERESVDLGGRESKDRRRRESELPPPASGLGRDVMPEPPIIDLKGRDPKERHNSRDDRFSDDRPREERLRDDRVRDERPRDDRPWDERPRDERPKDDRPRDEQRKDERDERDSDRERERARRQRSEASIAAAVSAATGAAVGGAVIDSREDSPTSDDAHPRSRREPRAQRESGAAPAPFNPKDTMDLKALKEALSRNSAPAPKDLVIAQRTPRQSVSNDGRALAEVRTDLDDYERSREPLIAPNKERQLRVVSPPREKLEDKPVKGILRQPRERFPEDPSPIREGVAPLKDAKKDGVPPDARWTKISRKLVNPAALEAGKERFEERDDFVIVLRVLSRDEVQGYAEVTERIRAAREELDRQERRRARRERHERHKKERLENGGERRRSRRTRGSESESDTTDGSGDERRPKMLEGPKPTMSGGSGGESGVGNNLKEDPNAPGQYTGYTRNPPTLSAAGTAGRKDRD